MLSFISGELMAALDERIIIYTNTGLAYEVYYKHENLPAAVEPGMHFSCWLAQVFQKDGTSRLYGFPDIYAKQVYEIASTVAGFGPKTAFTLASEVEFERFAAAISYKKPELLGKIKGIGSRMTSRLVNDLHGKSFNIFGSDGFSSSPTVFDESFARLLDDSGIEFKAETNGQTGSKKQKSENENAEEAFLGDLFPLLNDLGGPMDAVMVVDGLVNLGFSQEEAGLALRKALEDNAEAWKDGTYDSKKLFEESLKRLS